MSQWAYQRVTDGQTDENQNSSSVARKQDIATSGATKAVNFTDVEHFQTELFLAYGVDSCAVGSRDL